jgi:hypothetical protein
VLKTFFREREVFTGVLDRLPLFSNIRGGAFDSVTQGAKFLLWLHGFPLILLLLHSYARASVLQKRA